MSTQRFSKEIVDVLGVRIHRVTMSECVEKILHWTETDTHHMVITAGPEFVMQCEQSSALQQIAQSADLVTADGVGVVWAASRTGRPVPERVTGVELLPAVFAEAQARNHPMRVFILGATEASLDACLANLRETYPSIVFEGRNGYFTPADVDGIVTDIRAFAPQLLLVGLGQPRQEQWIHSVLGRLHPCVGIGIGGSIDVWGGTVTRAPMVFRKLNVEWLYRLLSQPSRFRRQLALPRFAFKVLRQRTDVRLS